MSTSVACGLTPAVVARPGVVWARTCSSRVYSRTTWRNMWQYHSRLMSSTSPQRSGRPSLTRAIKFDFDLDASDYEEKPQLQNKLNLPPDALQHIARGWKSNARSDVPVDLLSAVADLPMTDGTFRSPSLQKCLSGCTRRCNNTTCLQMFQTFRHAQQA